MSAMQEAIDRSIARASDVTREMFGDLVWTADEVISFINSVRMATVATGRNRGRSQCVRPTQSLDTPRQTA